MKKFFLLLPLLLLSGGCALPAGDPPPGNIVSNPHSAERPSAATVEEGMEMVIPELTAALLNEAPGEAVFLDAGNKVRPFAFRVLTECGKLTGSTPGGASANCRLQLRVKGKEWHWKLFKNDREVWSKTVLLR